MSDGTSTPRLLRELFSQSSSNGGLLLVFTEGHKDAPVEAAHEARISTDWPRQPVVAG